MTIFLYFKLKYDLYFDSDWTLLFYNFSIPGVFCAATDHVPEDLPSLPGIATGRPSNAFKVAGVSVETHLNVLELFLQKELDRCVHFTDGSEL